MSHSKTIDDGGHTPGPWQVEFGHTQTASGIQYWQVTDGSDAICCNQFCYAGSAQANACLIAAAPDLLGALAGLLEAYSKPDERLCCDGRDCGCMGSTVHQQAEHYARAAIAKATGESK